MKLYEEFKEYETLWEDIEEPTKQEPVTLKQGGKIYNIADEKEFIELVNSYAESKVKTAYKKKLDSTLPSDKEEIAAYADVQKIRIAKTLVNELESKKADAETVNTAKSFVASLEDNYDKAAYSPLARRAMNKYL
jgi:hypothetical protein